MGVGVRRHHVDQPTEGRIERLAPKGNLVLIETLVIVSLGAENRGMVWTVGLNQHAPLSLAAPRAPCHLHQQLESALAGAKVGQV
ncbi:hypothetical protein HRbin14_01982 [bacterium HR14]|nr:hypothetical protein HRbin14_01982 [bacterium HR14]